MGHQGRFGAVPSCSSRTSFQLPQEIEKLTKQIMLIENRLSDMNFYHKEPETYRAHALQVEELKHQLGSKEQKWLELELKREALGEIV